MNNKTNNHEIYLHQTSTAEVLREVTELRSENRKVFQMSDGTRKAIFFSAPVHGYDTETLAYREVSESDVAAASEEGFSLITSGTEVGNGACRVGVETSGAGSGSRYTMQVTCSNLLMPANSRVKRAELVLARAGYQCSADHKPYIYVENDYEPLDQTVYTFDVTESLQKLYLSDAESVTMEVTVDDTMSNWSHYVDIYGSNAASDKKPYLSVTFEDLSGNEPEASHTHPLGTVGQSAVNLSGGNFLLDLQDFAWAGNRMPITLQHRYNSAYGDASYTADIASGLHIADFSGMGLGYGWRLNLMQSMILKDGKYVYVDEGGDSTEFTEDAEQTATDADGAVYSLYVKDDVTYDPVKRELSDGSEVRTFDIAGRLISVKDEYGNAMHLTYEANRLIRVTDGVGREFIFTYDSNSKLIKITAPDDTTMQYTYTGNLLTTLIYPDGKKLVLTYDDNKPVSAEIRDQNNAPQYKMVYTFTSHHLMGAAEYGVKEDGAYTLGISHSYTYSDAARRTVVEKIEPMDAAAGDTADTITRTIYAFDAEGSIVSQYSVDENGSLLESDAFPRNLLLDHGFSALTNWATCDCNCGELVKEVITDENIARYGKKVVSLQTTNVSASDTGLYQDVMTLPAGNYVFSAYVKVAEEFTAEDGMAAGVYLKVGSRGNILAETEHVSVTEGDYIRLVAPFELESSWSVNPMILLEGMGTVYVDGAQLEEGSTAGDYNLLTNGNFEHGMTGWTITGNAAVSTAEKIDLSQSVKLEGEISTAQHLCQEVDVKSLNSTRETFTLSGWGKGTGLTDKVREGANSPVFQLKAVVKYSDVAEGKEQEEPYTISFNPCTEEWQFVSLTFSKEQFRPVESVKIYCDYSYNSGEVFFDDVQLVRSFLETGLTAEDFETEETEEDNNETSEEETTAEFEEAKDAFGNTLTQTVFEEGKEGVLYSSYQYSPDGNHLIGETDNRGNRTTYTVDAETSRNTEVTDRCGNKTAYEYDAAGRTTKVTSKKADGTEVAHVEYSYDSFDNLTEITRGDGMAYTLQYNPFHNLESIGVKNGNNLAQYTYKDGNGRLKEVTYANGHTMKVWYDRFGNMTEEKWFASDNSIMAHYKYTYDRQGNMVRSLDILQNFLYDYEYRDDRMVQEVQSTVTLNSDHVITSKTMIHTVTYRYNEDGQLLKKTITSAANGVEQILTYTYPEEGEPTLSIAVGTETIACQSETDHLNRKVSDQTGSISRTFTYHTGAMTAEHQASGKNKGSATTLLVSQITLSNGRTLSYEYDKEERITKVIDSAEGTTEYTYDALGQLLTETKNGSPVNTMTYDNYGNILTKNGKQYCYEDSIWKDKLTCYDGQSITYDAQGNPTLYLGHNLSWEKGRQLKTFDNNIYTYNANGIRTSKTVNGIQHTYTLDGTKILKETWGSNTLIPLYDQDESVCGIVYNNVPYTFLKNLQGDVIAIADSTGNTVARYEYDAWGVCTVTENNSADIANVNPFRYRGYYYDSETSLYYLQSRYYDAVVGRFVNSDSVQMIGGFHITSGNLFVYCGNNSVMDFDINGALGWSTFLQVMQYVFDFFVRAAQMAGSMSKEMENIIKKIKKAANNNASKEWIKELKKRKKSLLKSSSLGVGKFDKIASILEIVVVVIPYLSYLKKIKDGVSLLAELVIDIVVELIDLLVGVLASLICKVIPYVGFLLDWALGIVIDKFLDMIFHENRMSQMKKTYAKMVKNSSDYIYWFKCIFKTFKKVF